MTYLFEICIFQGGNKRPGAFAIYLEPWHADIYDFLDLRKNHGKEEQRARDLFLALWVPDLFMKRVKEFGDWCLMCPNESPGKNIFIKEITFLTVRLNQYLHSSVWKIWKFTYLWQKLREINVFTKFS